MHSAHSGSVLAVAFLAAQSPSSGCPIGVSLCRMPVPQLFGLLSRQPELAPYYQGSLQQALLWGMSEDPGQNGVVSAQPCLPVQRAFRAFSV